MSDDGRPPGKPARASHRTSSSAARPAPCRKFGLPVPAASERTASRRALNAGSAAQASTRANRIGAERDGSSAGAWGQAGLHVWTNQEHSRPGTFDPALPKCRRWPRRPVLAVVFFVRCRESLLCVPCSWRLTKWRCNSLQRDVPGWIAEAGLHPRRICTVQIGGCVDWSCDGL